MDDGRATQLGPDPPHVVDVLLHVEVGLPHQPVPSHGLPRGRGLHGDAEVPHGVCGDEPQVVFCQW